MSAGASTSDTNKRRTSSRSTGSGSTDRSKVGETQSKNLMAAEAQHTPKEDHCGVCKKRCTKGEKALVCDLCGNWFHAACQKISDEVYEVICRDSNADSPAIRWYCKPSCNKVADKFLGGFRVMQQEVERLGKEVDEVKERVDKIEEGEFPQKMKEAVINLTGDRQNPGSASAPVDKEEIEKMVDSRAKEHMAEAEDRVRRSRNIVIFNLPEPVTEDREERQAEENDSVGKMMHEIRCRHAPVDVRRLGNFSAKQQRARPLRLTFASQADRDETLQAFRKAKREENDEEDVADQKLCNKVSVRKDLTPTERKEQDALYQEIKRKREMSKKEGDQLAKWTSKNGRVINVGRYPSKEGKERK